jgi:predicted nucleic acid-binding protein
VIVVDTNTVVPLLMKKHEARKLARRARSLDRQWVMPSFWRVELQSALARYARNGDITWDDFEKALRRSSELLPPGATDREASADEVRRLLRQHPKLSAYDAQFLALARKLGVPLVTNDRKSLADLVKDPSIVRLSSFAA